MTSLKNINLNEFIKKEKMTNLKDKLKIMYESYVKHPIRNTILTGLGLATIVGTFGGNEGGFAPIYNKKAGTWGGINLGIYNEFQDSSKFYGVSIGIVQGIKDHFTKNKFYGVQVGVINKAYNMDGVQVGALLNAAEEMNGVQVGTINKNQKECSTLLGFGNGKGKNNSPINKDL